MAVKAPRDQGSLLEGVGGQEAEDQLQQFVGEILYLQSESVEREPGARAYRAWSAAWMRRGREVVRLTGDSGSWLGGRGASTPQPEVILAMGRSQAFAGHLMTLGGTRNTR